jgi:hypothetical protein
MQKVCSAGNAENISGFQRFSSQRREREQIRHTEKLTIFTWQTSIHFNTKTSVNIELLRVDAHKSCADVFAKDNSVDRVTIIIAWPHL